MGIRGQVLVAGVAVCITATLITGLCTGAQAGELLIDAAIAAIMSGDREKFVSLFRYFDDVVSPSDASRDRLGVGVYFDLLREELGRPDRFEPTLTTSSTFLNIDLESATPDLWRNSDCLFKTSAFKTMFAGNDGRLPTEVFFNVCVDKRGHQWLRAINVHLLNTNTETMRRAQRFLNRFMQELQGLRS